MSTIEQKIKDDIAAVKVEESKIATFIKANWGHWVSWAGIIASWYFRR